MYVTINILMIYSPILVYVVAEAIIINKKKKGLAVYISPRASQNLACRSCT